MGLTPPTSHQGVQDPTPPKISLMEAETKTSSLGPPSATAPQEAMGAQIWAGITAGHPRNPAVGCRCPKQPCQQSGLISTRKFMEKASIASAFGENMIKSRDERVGSLSSSQGASRPSPWPPCPTVLLPKDKTIQLGRARREKPRIWGCLERCAGDRETAHGQHRVGGDPGTGHSSTGGGGHRASAPRAGAKHVTGSGGLGDQGGCSGGEHRTHGLPIPLRLKPRGRGYPTDPPTVPCRRAPAQHPAQWVPSALPLPVAPRHPEAGDQQQ